MAAFPAKMNAVIKLLALSFLGLLGFSCSDSQGKEKKHEPEKETLFSLLDSSATGIHFINEVKNQPEFNIFRYRNFYNGAGVGIGDINNDGLSDVYLTSNMGSNRLFLNKGNFKFEDITQTSGTGGKKAWSTGVSLADINNDGFLDIYVSNAGQVEGDDRANELFINNGDLSFTEAAENFQLDENGFTTHASFFDYDQDGDLDAYILNNSFIPASSLGYVNKRELRSEDWDVPDTFKGGGDKLLRNNNGIFEDVSEEAGIYGSLIGFGLGVTIGDANYDALPDIYVSNDFYERDYLYINNGDGSFTEDIKNRISHLSHYSMGADMADINNDGLPEIFVTDMLPRDDQRLKNTSDFERFDLYQRKLNNDFYHQFMQNTLQLNNGNNTFTEIGYYSGVAQTDWSWGALVFDMDNDGHKDIYVSNGIYHDLTNQDFMDFFANEILQEMVLTGKKKEFDSILHQMPSTPIPNSAFRNNADLTFESVSADWGFSIPSFSNGSAYGDLDNDGDLDLVVNNVNQELFVYRNNSEKMSGNNYLRIKLQGGSSNRFGIGSKITLFLKDNQVSQQLVPTRGFQSSVDYTLVFGLGAAASIDSLQVTWPDKMQQTLKGVQINQTLTLEQENASEVWHPSYSSPKGLLTEIENNIAPHKEDPHVDFDYEGLIHRMLSTEGPAVAVGDVDQDGNDDLYFGGAKNQSGQLLLYKNGDFTPVSNSIFEQDKTFEDTDAAFADVNGDGMPDLIVASGGNTSYSDKDLFRTRIYLNQGQGNFKASENSIVSSGHNSSVVAPYDFDADGDVDLFIGGRSVSGVYGINPQHQLLENDGGGRFKDVIEAKAYEILDVGMITDARWEDMDGDTKADLVIVGDWMAPKIFRNTGKDLLPLASNLEQFTGAWNSVKAADLNQDGHMDLILGNRGLNSFYETEEKAPVVVYINDFDNNGTIEQIFTRSIDGKEVPIHLRRELAGQIASVKKQNLKFAEYATKSIDELFSEEVLANSIKRSISTFKSSIAYNNGDASFRVEELPAQVQFSSVHAIEVLEREEALPLILLAGNDYNLKPQFGRLDGNRGILLVPDASGKYLVMDTKSSGFQLQGQVRAIKNASDREGNRFLVVGINDEAPKIFKVSHENL